VDPSGPSSQALAPAQLAKAALRRLALSKLEPTPENYARAYAEEGGGAAALPDKLKPLLEQLAHRATDDAALREDLLRALAGGQWEQGGAALERMAGAAEARSRGWAETIEKLSRGLGRGSRQWSSARRRDSLQRVLDGSRSDMHRLQQRLQSLLGAWDSDGVPADEGASDLAPGAEAEAAPLASGAPASAAPRHAGAEPPGEWPRAALELERTVQVALPETEPRARALADQLAALAARLPLEGATPALVGGIEAVCVEARRLFQQRHRLLDELTGLCRELTAGLTDLAEDDSWARGQCAQLQARLAEDPNVRSVRAAQEFLSETRERQQRVRAERNAARDAIKSMIQRMLSELGELGEHTDRFQENIGRHAEAVERAESLESLAGVVREIVSESRSVQQIVQQTQQRLQGEHARAGELEARVRELESELRRLSDEATTDALTQVANRRGLAAAFDTELARMAREGEGTATLSMALIDIDNFKKLNDSLGHAAGDQALRALSAAVKERLRPGDHLARFGGEEFVVLLPATGDLEAQDVLNRLQRSLTASLFMHDDKEVFVTFSAGVTAWRPGEALDAALERADEALYEAKRTGKNRTCRA
jgi:diguanylate cyclase